MSQMVLTSPMRNRMTQPERPATVEQHCTTPGCTAGLWTVQLLSAANALWRVSSAAGGSYLVAGTTPACPWCGAALAVAAQSHPEPAINGLPQSISWEYAATDQAITHEIYHDNAVLEFPQSQERFEGKANFMA